MEPWGAVMAGIYRYCAVRKGRMVGIETTAIGGNNYANTTTNISYCNAIGVAGAPAGTAYESYQPNDSHTPRVGVERLPALVSSLMLNAATILLLCTQGLS